MVVVMAGLLVYGSYISAQYQMEALRTSTREQWTQLDGALRRMAELTPELEAAVAPAGQQNEAALEALTTAQRTLLQAHDPQAVMGASRALDEALDSVMAVGLSDPKVKGDASFEAMRGRLRGMRARIAEDRDRYNESLRNYNLFLGEFPNELWARIAGYGPDRHFFSAPQGQS